MIGPQLQGKVIIELSMLEVRGLQDTQLGEELTKKEACGSTMGRHTFAYDATYRRAVWLPRGQLGKDYSTLAGLVLRLLSLHATSCAPERNWSQITLNVPLQTSMHAGSLDGAEYAVQVH